MDSYYCMLYSIACCLGAHFDDSCVNHSDIE
jgi:hypothetical protein